MFFNSNEIGFFRFKWCIRQFLLLRRKLTWTQTFELISFFLAIYDTRALVKLHSLRRCPFLKQMKQKALALDFLLCKSGYLLHSLIQCCFPQYTYIFLFVSPSVNDPVDWLLSSDLYRWWLLKSLVQFSQSIRCRSNFYILPVWVVLFLLTLIW